MRYTGKDGASRRAASCWSVVPTCFKNGTRIAGGGTSRSSARTGRQRHAEARGGCEAHPGRPRAGRPDRRHGHVHAPGSGLRRRRHVGMAGRYDLRRDDPRSDGRTVAHDGGIQAAQRPERRPGRRCCPSEARLSRRVRPHSTSRAPIDNRGTWKVRSGKAATITGNGVTRPSVVFGRLDASGGGLTVTNARLELARDPSLPLPAC